MNGGEKMKLGTSPNDVSEQARIDFESFLGRESFVDPSSALSKQPGKVALTFAQLK